MLSVSLDGTLGIVGHKKGVLYCFVCKNKTCPHVKAVSNPVNANLPAVMEFTSAAGISQPRYERDCLSKQKIPFFVDDMREYTEKIRCSPREYLLREDSEEYDEDLSVVGKSWICGCGGDANVFYCATEPLFSRDYLIEVRGESISFLRSFF